LEQVQILQQVAQKGWLIRQEQKEFEKVDNIVAAADIYAEQHCCKFKCGQVEWCPRATRSINKILYWKGICSHQQGSRIGISVLKTRAKKAGIPYDLEHLTWTPKTIQQSIKQAYSYYEQIKKTGIKKMDRAGDCSTSSGDKKCSKSTLWKQVK